MSDGAKLAVSQSQTRAAIKSYLQPRTATMLVLGSACGLPLLTISNTLGLWLTDNKVSMTDIGLFAYTLLPYSLKFVWAPILDQVRLPVLHPLLGKRRAWMLVAQLGILIAFMGLWFSDPQTQLVQVALFALLLGFSGASQDISVDAWRIEVAPAEEQGTMLGAYQLGYRLTALATAALAPYLAQMMSWRAGLIFLGCLIFLGMAATFAARKPDEHDASGEAQAIEEKLNMRGRIGHGIGWLYGAIVAPFIDFFRHHRWAGLLILAMIGLYRLPDFVMGVMARPMYRQSFSLVEIGTMSGLVGVWVTILGALIGGLFVFRFGIMRSLFIGLIAVIVGNLMYALLAASGHDIAIFATAIGVENIAAGFAGTALLAYMSSLTNQVVHGHAIRAFQFVLCLARQTARWTFRISGRLVRGPAPRLRGMASHACDVAGQGGGVRPVFVTTALAGLPALVLLILVRQNRCARA